jgi:cell division transport system ATP-binding protein
MLINYENVDIYQEDFKVLHSVNFQLNEGEFVYFVGKVGTGKTSVLKTIYGELDINTGNAEVLGFDMLRIKRKNIPLLRRQLGIVFQDFQLLTDRSVHSNLQFVLKATGWNDKSKIEQRITEVLTTVDLLGKLESMPHELSGGEKQRVAIARALLNKPKIILADEPTGNLDMESGAKITAILHEICNSGTAVIMSTHNLALLHNYPGVVYQFSEGEMKEKTSDYNRSAESDDEKEGKDTEESTESDSSFMYAEKEEE